LPEGGRREEEEEEQQEEEQFAKPLIDMEMD
jgi:hypothetical protein